MSNVLRVWKRDIIRLFKAPAALIVVGALIVLPSLYTWFNVIGFWNPYDNTGNLRVCVVNEDEGAENDLMGKLDIGSQIVESLEGNDQLGWAFVDRATAETEVESGRAYAMFVIPQDFSRRFTTLLSENLEQPVLEYYVNEKNGAVAPKITDTGATTLDETINSTFTAEASKAVADAVDSALADFRARLSGSNADVSGKLGASVTAIQEARSSLGELNGHIATAAEQAEKAKGALDSANEDLALVSQSLDSTAAITSEMQTGIAGFWAKAQTILDESSSLASRSSEKSNRSIARIAQSVTAAQGKVNAAIAGGQAVLEHAHLVTTELELLLKIVPESSSAHALLAEQIATLNAFHNDLSTSLESLRTMGNDVGTTATSIAELSNAADQALQATLKAENDFRSTMSGSVVPALANSMAQISSTASDLSVTATNQKALVSQARSTIEEFTATLGSVTEAVLSSDELLAGLESSLITVRTDIAAIGTTDLFTSALGEDDLDSGKIAEFMQSPTEVITESPYHLNAYGSAMAPLFTNLTLWIGVFMLLVILKQEVDDEGVPNLTIRQRYAARWLFLAPIALLQALVCCIGNLAIGVQTVNAVLYVITAVVISLAFLSVQYALATTMQHVGKGLCIVLVFAQIPGATGLYPIEMTPPFFQALYPVFPFTYGINAMRETIAGLYGAQWASSISVLLGFFSAFFIAGLIAIPYLTNLNRLFARQIRESNIMNGEEGRIPEHRFRLDLILQLLSDHEEYRTKLSERADRFFRLYPRLKRGAWVFGIAVPAVATIAFAVQGSAKVFILSAWLVWLVAIIAFLIVLEYLHNSIERQLSLGNMSEGELQAYYRGRESKPPVLGGERTAAGERGGKRAVATRARSDASRSDASGSDGSGSQGSPSTPDAARDAARDAENESAKGGE